MNLGPNSCVMAAMDILFEIVAPPGLAQELAADTSDGSRRTLEKATGTILDSYLEQVADVVTIAVGVQQFAPCLAGLVRRLLAARNASPRQSVSVIVRGADDVIIAVDQSSDAASVEQRIRIAVTK